MTLSILHVAYSCIPGVYHGGISKIVYELSQAQAALGHHVTIFTTNYNYPEKVDVPLQQPVVSDGVTLWYFPAHHPRWMRSPALRAALLSPEVAFDVVHSHNTWLALNKYAAEAAQRHRARLFYHTHGALDPVVVNRGWRMQMRKRLYLALLEKKNYARADVLFANTGQEEEQIRYFGIQTPVRVVPNGISFCPPENIEAVTAEFCRRHSIAEHQPVILFIGRIVPKKGVHLLIEALAAVRRHYPEAVLVVVGDRRQDSSYTAHLDELAVSHGVAEAIRWPGFLNDQEKLGAYAAATLFAHPSESEGMSMSILEAMAAGLPVVVSKQAYMGKAAQAEALVECDRTVAAVQSSIEWLLADGARRAMLGRNARAYVQQHHSWRHAAELTIDSYLGAIEQRKATYQHVNQ
jgi:glycosyltransferase involved in cell wall biosynthesis